MKLAGKRDVVGPAEGLVWSLYVQWHKIAQHQQAEADTGTVVNGLRLETAAVSAHCS